MQAPHGRYRSAIPTVLGPRLQVGASSVARVASLAQAGECLVSRTVKDLVAGADIHFSERGKRDLKGLAEPIDLYAAAARGP